MYTYRGTLVNADCQPYGSTYDINFHDNPTNGNYLSVKTDNNYYPYVDALQPGKYLVMIPRRSASIIELTASNTFPYRLVTCTDTLGPSIFVY